MALQAKNFEVVEREMGRARVTMEWEVDAEYETTEGGNMRLVGWLASAKDVVAQCDPAKALKLTIQRVAPITPSDPVCYFCKRPYPLGTVHSCQIGTNRWHTEQVTES